MGRRVRADTRCHQRNANGRPVRFGVTAHPLSCGRGSLERQRAQSAPVIGWTLASLSQRRAPRDAVHISLFPARSVAAGTRGGSVFRVRMRDGCWPLHVSRRRRWRPRSWRNTQARIELRRHTAVLAVRYVDILFPGSQERPRASTSAPVSLARRGVLQPLYRKQHCQPLWARATRAVKSFGGVRERG